MTEKEREKREGRERQERREGKRRKQRGWGERRGREKRKDNFSSPS